MQLLDESLGLIGLVIGVAVGCGHSAASLEMLDGLLGQFELLQQLLLHGDAVLVRIVANDVVSGRQVEGHAYVAATLNDELDHLTPVVVRLQDVRVSDDDQKSLSTCDGNIEALEWKEPNYKSLKHLQKLKLWMAPIYLLNSTKIEWIDIIFNDVNNLQK